MSTFYEVLGEYGHGLRGQRALLVRSPVAGRHERGIRASECIFDEPIDGVWASDHFGVVAELSVPDVCF